MLIRLRAMALAALVLVAVGFGVAQPRAAVDAAATAPMLAALYAPAAELAEEHVLLRGETLSDVFERALGRSELSGLVLAVQEQVNPRRVMPNTRILVRRLAEDGAPRTVEVALNADSTLRLKRGSVSWTGELLLTPTVVDTIAVSGRLAEGGSLYSAFVDQADVELPYGERQALVWRLAHIYGWEVDFIHDMRPGDSFRVIFEREARPDGTSRDARVLAAEVLTRGRSIPAIHFDPRGDGGDYFNTGGSSLRLTFLRYPVDFPRITSNFSRQRFHPVLQRNRPHLGTDFGTGYGAPVKSTADGTVSFSAWDGGYGNLVRINHGNGYETRYAHLSRFAPGVRRGARVRQGQVIGYTGATGLATAPHLHYELRHNGQARDPRTVRLPSAPPVPAEHVGTFRALADQRMTLLDALTPPHGSAVVADGMAAARLRGD